MLASPLVLAALLAQFASSIPAPPLRVATFNVQALSAKDSDARFELVARQVANAAFPPLLALQEMADDDGTSNTGETRAEATLARLTFAIGRAGGPPYQALAIDPIDNAEGGPPGANIRNVVLTTLPFILRQGSRADVQIKPGPAGPALFPNPGRWGHSQQAYNNTRRPLFAELLWHKLPLILINVHLSAGPTGRNKRAEQVQALSQFLLPMRQAWPEVPVILLGDFNANDDEPLAAPFERLGLRDSVPDRAPTHQTGARFDRIFVSQALLTSQGRVQPFSAASDHALVWVDLQAAAWHAAAPPGGCQFGPGRPHAHGAAAAMAWLWILAHCRRRARCGRMHAFNRPRCKRAKHDWLRGPQPKDPSP